MAAKFANASDRINPVSLLSERLTAVVKEHHDWLAEQDNVELKSLRFEVSRLRDEVSRLQQEGVGAKNVDKMASSMIISLDGDDEPLPRNAAVSFPSKSSSKDPGSVAVSFASKASSQDVPSCVTDSSLVGETRVLRLFEGTESSDLTSTLGTNAITGTMSGQHIRTLKDTEAEMMDLKKKFHELDPGKRGYIDVRGLVGHMTKHHNNNESKREQEVQRIRVAIHKLNKHIGILAHNSHSSASGHRVSRRGHIHFEAFKVLMLEEITTLQDTFGDAITEALIEVRETLVSDVMLHQIAKTLHMHENTIREHDPRTTEKSKTLRMLEPVVAVMIILNALLIGLSLDLHPRWNGWFVVEAIFTCFFLAEFIICVCVRGCSEHFLGEDWCWSWFDFLIVCSAVLDTVITTLAKIGVSGVEGVNLNHLLVLRLVRLVRITRLIRILHLKMFKELTLMLNGVIAGLRTLFWAIVLLTVFIYALGVLMRQFMHPDHRDPKCSGNATSEECNRGEQNMEDYGHILFGNVGRSMLAIFMCFTDGCSSPDGTPLIWHLWDTHGPILVLGYVFAFLFISFGVMNLIMAVFVENTLVSAQRTDAERQFGAQSNHMKKAQELQTLLIKFCKAYDAVTPEMAKLHQKTINSKGLKKIYSKYKEKGSTRYGLGSDPGYLHMRITQDQFEEVLADKEVNDLLDDLDISCISRDQLFDILDADGNGYLAISELVDGIMKLRGPADKGDGVAAVLMVRQLQKQVSKFEEHMYREFHKVDRTVKMDKLKQNAGPTGP